MLDAQTKYKKSIQNFILYSNISDSSITAFNVDSRCLIEEKNLKSEYPILSFYTNWALHYNIDRDPFLYNLFGEISNDFSSAGEKGGYDIIPKLKMLELAKELISFLQYVHNSEPITLPSTDFLQRLYFGIFHNLKFRRVHFPIEKTKDSTKKIQLIIENAKKQAEQIDKNTQGLDPSLDYSKPWVVKSIEIKDVVEGKITFEMQLSDETKELHNLQLSKINIHQKVSVLIQMNDNGQIRIEFK